MICDATSHQRACERRYLRTTCSVNQIVPSAAVAMPKGSEPATGSVISVMADVLVAFVGMRPTRFPSGSVKYNALSDTRPQMPLGKLPAAGSAISEISAPTSRWRPEY